MAAVKCLGRGNGIIDGMAVVESDGQDRIGSMGKAADLTKDSVLLMAPVTCGELPAKSTIRLSFPTVISTWIGIGRSLKPSSSI